MEFAVVFALIWIAWVNGSLYLEVHGRDDGRTRSAVFIQMGLLAVLAVSTAEAAGETGGTFAVVYAAFLAVQTGLWAAVRREDRHSRPEFVPVTGPYVGGLAASAVVFLASTALPPGLRLVVWAGFAAAWIAGIWLAGRSPLGLYQGLAPTASLVERFGAFTIIVLGEVILGVVNGLSVAEPDLKTLWTGIFGLILGFGFWWIYFDVVGGRLPRNQGLALASWALSHYPITLSIAAGGAAVFSLIAHAHDAETPPETAALLAGAVAVGLLAQAWTAWSLVDADRLRAVYKPLGVAMAVAAVIAAGTSWLRLAPWLLILILVAILTVLWLVAVGLFIRADAWGDERSASA